MELRRITVGRVFDNRGQMIPFIRVRGNYLRQLGFFVGDKLQIRFVNNELVLSKEVVPNVCDPVATKVVV